MTSFDSLSAERYAFTHGHRPRGIGFWSFSLGRCDAWTSFRYEGSYTDAKKAALREARSLGCDTVCVDT